jgi:hypothetical protein
MNRTLSAPAHSKASVFVLITTKIAIGSVLLLYLSFHLWGLGVLKVPVPGLGVMHLTHWDVAALVIAYFWLVQAMRAPIVITNAMRVTFALAVIFFLWVVVSAVRSPEPFRGATMVGLLLRDLVVLFTVSTLTARLQTLDSLNRGVFYIGAVIAAVATLLYLVNASPDLDAADPAGKHAFGGIILFVGEFNALRLVGFAKDPIYFSLLISVALFCGLSSVGINRLVLWSGLLLIGVAAMLTFSRMWVLAMPTVFLSVWLVLWLTHAHSFPTRRVALLLLFVVGLFAIMMVVGLPGADVQSWVASRIDALATTPRFARWELLLNQDTNFLLGAGLRSSEIILGQHSENSYLDLIFEMGVVGFVVWAALTAYITSRLVLMAGRRPSITPWLMAWATLFVYFMGVSFIFHPLYWMVAGLALGQTSADPWAEPRAKPEVESPPS